MRRARTVACEVLAEFVHELGQRHALYPARAEVEELWLEYLVVVLVGRAPQHVHNGLLPRAADLGHLLLFLDVLERDGASPEER